jgi:predicted RNase H-like HicB family nuclease
LFGGHIGDHSDYQEYEYIYSEKIFISGGIAILTLLNEVIGRYPMNYPKIKELAHCKRESTMKRIQQFTAIIEREDDGYVSLCPELDIASQGDSVEEAKNNLLEALQLFFEVADPSEIENRLHTEVFVTQLEVAIG